MRLPIVFRRSPVAFGLGLALALCSLSADRAAAQNECMISGPTSTCGGSVQLCGPEGLYLYEWTGPNGFTATSRCINVSDPGVYSMRIQDIEFGVFFGPCTHNLTSGAGGGGSCVISGPTSVCQGQSVELCGPDGNLRWAWSGPGGFSASSRCVSVSNPGLYSLSVSDAAGGCGAMTCSQNVASQNCQSSSNCPRNAKFWQRQGAGKGRDLSPSQIRELAGWVDQRASVFNWSDDVAGFNNALNRPSDGNWRKRAMRQFAALLANCGARASGLRSAGGNSMGLDMNTQVGGSNGSFTLGAWISSTDARLVALTGRSSQDREAIRAYKSIWAVALAMNHGRGVGPICAPPGRVDPSECDVDDDSNEGS
ncbi:MAG: hypothetical protein HOP12_03705 [Candidatus Eisenbacteria bacterium]|uniref:Ig-like domain-containing protein n=1 Tax=Eiseniibacteriota bacterium TaxID=2212470 RepID=A0A849SK94_UNCEI|nr:hypothetical protein [Candidatus Eisenbacteria bacterium]